MHACVRACMRACVLYACVSELFSVCLFLRFQKFEDHTQSDDEENRFSSFAQTAENTFMPSSDSDGECSHCDGKPGHSA